MSSQRTVLVTGAGGFIGGRVVEVLHQLGADHVRAGLRTWGSGARVGRLPVELVQVDIRDDDQLRRALADVTHVVNLAVGEPSTTVDGTRKLLTAAHASGVQRVVHISTVDVYGQPEGAVDESRPLTITGRPYGDSKIEAERACQELAAKGLPVTILRPTLVHGPFSATWTVPYAQRLLKRPWLIPEAASQGICNLLYVDDLVSAVLAALSAETAPGEAFNVNGPERPTWHEYFTGLNDALGLPPLVEASPSGARVRSAAVQPLRKSAKFLISHFEPQIMRVAQRSLLARDAMLRAERLVRTTPSPAEFAVYQRQTSFSTSKAQETLGYRPRFPMATALPLTAAWLRHHGYVPGPGD
jgi:nucleoside-diphosphate-sugar epimerase